VRLVSGFVPRARRFATHLAALLAAVALAVCLPAPPHVHAAPGRQAADALAAPGPFEAVRTERPVMRRLAAGGQAAMPTTIWYPKRAGDDTRYPVVVYSHGLTGSPAASSILLSHLATYGFVVVAPQHDDCPTDCSEATIAAAAGQRLIDVAAALDAVLAGGPDQDPPADRLDATRVGLAGWSFGGATALRVMETDERFRAALALAPATVIQPADPRRVARPVMVVAGRLDTTIPFRDTARFYAAIPDSAPDRWFVAIDRAGHSFGDACLRDTADASFATRPCPQLLPQSEVNQIVAAWGTAFLERYVAGDQSAAPLLDPSTNTNPHVSVAMSAAGTPTTLPPPVDGGDS
jgi:predicted dienelactone hydrolase